MRGCIDEVLTRVNFEHVWRTGVQAEPICSLSDAQARAKPRTLGRYWQRWRRERRVWIDLCDRHARTRDCSFFCTSCTAAAMPTFNEINVSCVFIMHCTFYTLLRSTMCLSISLCLCHTPEWSREMDVESCDLCKKKGKSRALVFVGKYCTFWSEWDIISLCVTVFRKLGKIRPQVSSIIIMRNLIFTSVLCIASTKP